MNIREADIWKYVADTTISEVVHKGQENCIQKVVDDLARKARTMDLKCKELKISFARNQPEFDPICVNRHRDPRDCGTV